MNGRLPNGLRYAERDGVRVVLYAAGGGTVHTKCGDGHWRIASAGVSHDTIIKLTQEAMAAPEQHSHESKLKDLCYELACQDDAGLSVTLKRLIKTADRLMERMQKGAKS